MDVDWTKAGRDALDYAPPCAPLHLAAAFRAVSGHGRAFVFQACRRLLALNRGAGGMTEEPFSTAMISALLAVAGIKGDSAIAWIVLLADDNYEKCSAVPKTCHPHED